MPDGDINWLFSDVFRRLALVLENTKNQKQREQLQLVIEGVGAIKKIVKPIKKASRETFPDRPQEECEC